MKVLELSALYVQHAILIECRKVKLNCKLFDIWNKDFILHNAFCIVDKQALPIIVSYIISLFSKTFFV